MDPDVLEENRRLTVMMIVQMDSQPPKRRHDSHVIRAKTGIKSIKTVGDTIYVPANIAVHYVTVGMRMALSNPEACAEALRLDARKIQQHIQPQLDEI